jgi:BirA family transcriptional regulator, biotin operon repressor / biotin---[acetyl-CoA-carboxylase] ligase
MSDLEMIHLEEVDSTNAYARALFEQNELPADWTMIEAAYQTDGKGRTGSWEAVAGQNVLSSYIVYPQRPQEDYGCIPLLAGVAVADTIAHFLQNSVLVKWPNDVYCEGHKIAGILCESGSVGANRWVIIGIGVNVNQTVFEGEYRVHPISMALAGKRTLEIGEILSVLTEKLHAWFELWDAEGNNPILEAWKDRTDLMESAITFLDNGVLCKAIVRDINADGSLLVECENALTRSLYAEEISALTQKNCFTDKPHRSYDK